MIHWNKLPEKVKNDLRDAWAERDLNGMDDYESYCSRNVMDMSPQELMDEWLRWHGIINWTGSIVTTLDGIRAAEEKEGAVKLFGLVFTKGKPQDWYGFAGAEPGSLICNDGDTTYILSPERDMISVLKDEPNPPNNFTQCDWKWDGEVLP